MSDRLLTTRQAAEWLGVGPTSVKRWADDGRLACVRTAGGHRRFEAEVVRAFGRGIDGPSDAVDAFVDLLIARPSMATVQARLLELRARHGRWPDAATVVGEVLSRIGERWREGTLSVAEEHAATERLHRAITAIADQIPVAPSAPVCVLTVAGDDEHVLGLALVELCARSAGWQTLWLGGRADPAIIADTLAERDVRMLAVSASSWSEDAVTLARLARDLQELCRPRDIALIVGGRGAWPTVLPYGERLTTFDAFADRLDEVYARGIPKDGTRDVGYHR